MGCQCDVINVKSFHEISRYLFPGYAPDSIEEIIKSEKLKNLESYYETFVLLLKIWASIQIHNK